jgi:hypothetical protein
MEQSDPHLHILLDIQKQLGILGRETGEQTQKLVSIEAQVKKTNGRVTALEEINKHLEQERQFVKGKMAIIGIIAGSVGTLIVGFIGKIISKYI